VVLPAYNEAANIEKAVLVTAETLFKTTDQFEIIIAEDGSTDGTDRIASGLSEQYAYVVHLHSLQEKSSAILMWTLRQI